uniref:Protein kinase domain-containing protein n=1 Tax=Parascaris univalens TaxID=6257 RepID=A0A915AYT8_PARUN
PELIKENDLQILEMLGSGSFGHVHKGMWSNREVAVKYVLHAKRSEVECIDRLIALKHPHLVTIFGLCENAPPYNGIPKNIGKDCFCIVMEYCGQKTLRNIINGEEAIRKDLFLMWTNQITSAMIYLYEQNLLHRDLKPENILLPADNSLKLCDFGTVREWKGATTSMTYCGTVRYMAPEVLQGKAYSHKADVWSFGVILWEMLVQQPPYEGQESPAIIFKIGKGELVLPELNIPENINSLSLLLKKCLDRNHHQRLSYNEIASSLERVKVFTGILAEELSSISENEWFEVKSNWRAKYAKNYECSVFLSEVSIQKYTQDDSGYSYRHQVSSDNSEQSQSYEENEFSIIRFDEFHDCSWDKPNLIAFVNLKVDTTVYLRAIEICGFIEEQNFKHESISVQLRNILRDVTMTDIRIKKIENGRNTMKLIFSKQCELIEETPYELDVFATVTNASKRYCCYGEGETTIRIREDRSVTFVFNEDECDPQTIIGFYLILPPQ